MFVAGAILCPMPRRCRIDQQVLAALLPPGRAVATHAAPDAYWEAYGVALELDSMAWHLSPNRYRRTQARQRDLVVHNVDVLPVAPQDAIENPGARCEQVMQKLRTPPDVRCPLSW